jgi:hypothetical protein
LFKIAVVSPEVRPVFAAVDEDAAGPCCPDAYVRATRVSHGVHVGDDRDTNREDPSNPGIEAGLSAA